MKKIKSLSIAMSALVLASCGGAGSSEDAKEKALDSVKVFAVDVATKVSKNQKDSVVMVYADAEKADSLVLNIVPDSVKVTEIDSVTFSADLGDGKTIGIKKDAQGKLTVTESKGLFAYPEKDLDFAKKTGMWTDSLTDAQFAERMATKEEFRNYLISTFVAPKPLVIKKGRVSSTGVYAMEYLAKLQYIVTNTSDKPVSGSEYNVVSRYEDLRGLEGPITWSNTDKGKDIAPKGSVTYTIEAGYYTIIKGVNIVYTSKNKAQQFEKHFQPKGDEYQKFLASKKK